MWAASDNLYLPGGGRTNPLGCSAGYHGLMLNWRSHRVAAALLVAYVAVAAIVLLWPTPIDEGLKSRLKHVALVLQGDFGSRIVTYGLIDSAANVLFFVPLGILVTIMVASRLWWVAPALGLALSSVAETAQFFLLSERYASLADVAANTSGAIIGTLLVPAARRAFVAAVLRVLRASDDPYPPVDPQLLVRPHLLVQSHPLVRPHLLIETGPATGSDLAPTLGLVELKP